ncbi:MAG: 23S rRNA (adenine(2030)-N(6))-methyltransferase RlmJ [Treponema sp.]|nr:23S rRNA (adenine(2030)-N(6))-methyltransferase RlmJ [Treponema sp.]
MLSYQHAFHAGNHADILKHYVLYLAIEALNKKDKPYTIYDTHSGSGLYDLYDNRSLKTGEAEKGIIKLLKDKNQAPESFKSFLDFISTFTKKNLYPGSPAIELSLCRKESDSIILSEIHPQEIENLKENIHQLNTEKKSVQIHNRNGWEMIKALTPPATKRGLVLIDPSYEETEDYLHAAEVIKAVNKKWSNGIILLWYPLLVHREMEISNMLDTIINSAQNVNQNVEIADIRLCVQDKAAHKEVSLEENAQIKNPPRLYGSGMLVINCPWKLQEQAQEAVTFTEAILKE